MRSKLKKALCCAAALAVTAGMAGISACSYYSADSLDGLAAEGEAAVSNGGFVVENGDYIYFINGNESYDADNKYGDVEKGSIVRISKEDYAAGNYSTVDTVVPLVVYSGNYDSGIYIYDNVIYYATPSSNRDSSGEVLNTQLEFKSTAMTESGTKTMKGSYIIIEDSSVEYRYVQNKAGDVYLLYVVEESIFDNVSSSAYNIHSLQITGENAGTNTLLAYDVDEYVFDTSDLENPYIYYTMDVTYNIGTGYDDETTDYSSVADYNQVYRVCAYDTDGFQYTAEDKYTKVFDKYVVDADGENGIYDYDEDPLYVNRGELVYDGIGAFSQMTIFNYGWEEYDAANDKINAGDSITGTIDANSLSGYSYSLTGYSDGMLYYTRSYYSSDDSSTPIWFYVTEDDINASDWHPIDDNYSVITNESGLASYDETGINHTLLLDGSSISSYTIYLDDNGVPTYLWSVETSTSGYAMWWRKLNIGEGTISTNTQESFPMAALTSDVTYLTSDVETVDGVEYTFIYYSVGDEGNSYSVHRIALYGTYDDYVKYPYDEVTGSNYQDTRILDLDVAGSWYMPEIIEGQFMFASSTNDMTEYNYIMVFDLRADDSTDSKITTMSNYEIEGLNDLYDDVIEVIDDTDEDNYENLLNALYYVFYTREDWYLEDLVQQWVDAGEDEEYLYSKESQQMYIDFYKAEGDYAKLFGDTADWSDKSYSSLAKYKTINGDNVYATSRNYFYSLIGYMSEDDLEDYIDAMRASYMQTEPDITWWDGLDTWVQVIFIVGVSLGGLLVIAAAVLIPVTIIRKKSKKLPSYTKARMKVDMTDDKDIDVYGTDDIDDVDVSGNTETTSEPDIPENTDNGNNE